MGDCMSQKKRVVIIGGGIIGTCSGLELAERGHEVVLVDAEPDASSTTHGCSYGNAGMIVPSHFVPLAAPGMPMMGIKMLSNPESPFGFALSPSPRIVTWALKFLTFCTDRHVSSSAEVLRDLNLRSRAKYLEYANSWDTGSSFGLEPKGLLMICGESKTFEHEAEMAHKARSLGLKAEVLNRDALQALEPEIEIKSAGGVHFQDDAHLTPARFMYAAKERIRSLGGTVVKGRSVGFEGTNGKLQKVRLEDGSSLEGDEFVLATGSWSQDVGETLGLKMPMLAGKGYGFTVPNPVQTPRYCSILVEARVAVTPMLDGVRFGGTMELGLPNDRINPKRIAGIRKSIPGFFPNFKQQDFQDLPIWYGLRPCSPDGLPYLGRTQKWTNLVVATGHAMMGMSLGPVSGELVAQVVSGEKPTVGLDKLHPERFQ